MAECTLTSLPIIELTGCLENPNALPTAWRRRSEDSPFVNPKTCEYSIVVDKAYIDPDTPVPETIQYVSPGTGADFEERMEGYAAYGVDKLLEYYNKLSPYGTAVGLYATAYNSIAARETADPASSYHASGRPNSNIKVLVTLPYDFNLLGNAIYTPDPDVPTIGAAYDVRLLKTKVDFVAKIIYDHYGKKHGTFGAKIRNLNLKDESGYMKDFVRELSKFLDENGVDIDLGSVLNTRDENLSFVFDSANYELLDVEYTNLKDETRSLRIGIGAFDRKLSSTTKALIYHTENELFFLFNNHINPPWVEFVEKYIYPSRTISMAIGANPKGLEKFNKNFTEGLNMTSEVLHWGGMATRVGEGSMSLIPLLDTYLKTQAEKVDEDGIIFNHNFQAHQQSRANNMVHFNIDSGFSIEDLETLRVDTLYELALNHVDLKYLAGKVVQCYGADPEIIDPIILEIIKNLELLLVGLPNMALSTIRIPDDMGFVEDIAEDFVEYVANFIFQVIQGLIVSLIQSVFQKLDEMCEEQFEYDGVGIESLLSDNFDSATEAAEFYGSLVGNLGDGTGTSTLFKELLAEISAVLTTNELCALMRGNATDEVLTIVYDIIHLDKYSSFHDRFETNKNVSKFFASIGGLINPTICGIGPFLSEELCEDGFNEASRRSLLEQNSGLTTEQIDAQIAAVREVRDQLINELTDIFNSGEDALNNRAADLLNNGALAQAAMNHPSTQNSMEQMIQTTFYPPLTSLAVEALGFRETPYYQVEEEVDLTVEIGEETVVIGTKKQMTEYDKNRGLINTLTTGEEYLTLINIFRDPETKNYFIPGDGFLFVNNGVGPGSENLEIEEGVSFWSYQTMFSFTYGTFTEDPSAITPFILLSDNRDKFNILYGSSAPIPSWWETEDENMDLAQIYSDGFLTRTPIVGIEDAAAGPIIKSYEYDGEKLLDYDNVNPWQFLNRTTEYAINIFNDLPSVIQDGLVPSYSEIEAFADSSTLELVPKQANTYLYHILNKIQNLNYEVASEIDYVDLVGTYSTVFNNVMRILFSFVTDNEFSDFTSAADILDSEVWDLLGNLKDNFKNPEELLKITGIENIKETMGEKLFSSFETGATANVAADAISEVSLRYMIRIYILEIFLKNIYMLTSAPEKRSQVTAMNIGYSQLLPYGGEIENNNFQDMLDLKDIMDPIMVSFIANSIKHSDERTDSCAAFRDVALRIAEAELASEAPEDGFLSVNITSEAGNVSDTLAYYPPRDEGEDATEAALKYYIAKELEDFVEEFQSFIEPSKLMPGFDGPDTTKKRPFMKSFLDKMETVGYNIAPDNDTYLTDGTTGEVVPDEDGEFDPDSHNYREFLKIGEGLYLEFYLRRSAEFLGLPFTSYGSSNEVIYADLLGTVDSRLVDEEGAVYDLEIKPFAGDSFGLRMCIRDRGTPDTGYDGRAAPLFENIAPDIFDFIGASEVGDATFAQIEKSYERIKGFPILELEIPYEEVRDQLGFSDDVDNFYASFDVRYQILEYLKDQLIVQDDFRVLFEYAFPVKKMFNFLFIIMTNSIDAFLSNPRNESDTHTPDRATRNVLNASAIDPEQFTEAKLIIKGILENVLNFNNYTYISEEVKNAGGIGNLSLNKSIEDL